MEHIRLFGETRFEDGCGFDYAKKHMGRTGDDAVSVTKETLVLALPVRDAPLALSLDKKVHQDGTGSKRPPSADIHKGGTNKDVFGKALAVQITPKLITHTVLGRETQRTVGNHKVPEQLLLQARRRHPGLCLPRRQTSSVCLCFAALSPTEADGKRQIDTARR
ncbi:UPF0606 protein [Liparis tanakae]|uniref:UPF0606 protein n=1 Tax=Liparis tanakae TaxID=230148 RepID=A0A4Z2I990_9TELE|nr:UPF0606 protein [Liparis tanakae]